MKRFFHPIAAVITFALLLAQIGCHHSKTYPLPEHPAMQQTAGVHLPHIFGDHMVLQAGMRVPVWGSSLPWEGITVQFAGQSVATHADADGIWQLSLLKLRDTDQGSEMTVTGDHDDVVTFRDVLVGEVWLGSGQSNMERQIKQVDRAAEFTAAANDPSIRLFTVKRHIAQEPVNDVEGNWEICTPQTLPTFSAVLYHFGLNLHKKLHTPMGLIHSSWGGTPIQAWTPAAGFTDEDAAAIRKTVSNRPRYPSAPSVLYNGMIAPISGYAMRGAIWYQGEADNSPKQAPVYGQRMQTMIDLWRSVWKEGDFPFYFVEIAPYGGYSTPETLPILWQQQIWVTHNVKNTGMAATGDIGNIKNIHPTNKHEVGRRLALIALAKTYGEKGLAYQGPTYRSQQIEGNKIRVHFADASGLKTCNGKPAAWFEIAGEDRHFVSAQATIDGNDVIVWANQVTNPRYVRLGWNQVAQINLCNRFGLPATPFESGD